VYSAAAHTHTIQAGMRVQRSSGTLRRLTDGCKNERLKEKNRIRADRFRALHMAAPMLTVQESRNSRPQAVFYFLIFTLDRSLSHC
jgi:hypothetical protein